MEQTEKNLLNNNKLKRDIWRPINYWNRSQKLLCDCPRKGCDISHVIKIDYFEFLKFVFLFLQPCRKTRKEQNLMIWESLD